jgi:hypothetical protein
MQRRPVFLNCPAYLSSDSAAQCGLPAEVETRYTMESTDGPLESAKIRCPRGHWFNGPIEFLTTPERRTLPTAELKALYQAGRYARVASDAPGGRIAGGSGKRG